MSTRKFIKKLTASLLFIHIENHKLCLWKNRAVALKR